MSPRGHEAGAWDTDPPECREPPSSRNNHLGNTLDAEGVSAAVRWFVTIGAPANALTLLAATSERCLNALEALADGPAPAQTKDKFGTSSHSGEADGPAPLSPHRWACDRAFFVGEHFLAEGQPDDARPYLQDAEAACGRESLPYLAAAADLARIGTATDSASTAPTR